MRTLFLTYQKDNNMKDLLDKISSYNLFNYLFPGVVFVIFASKLTSYNFVQQDILSGAFVYYFIGLIISRIGSLFIEPFLKLIKFLAFADYKKYVKASKTDTKIETLSEVNNMYRTISSMFLLLLFLKAYDSLGKNWTFLNEWEVEVATISLMLLFLFSYRKQTNYITKRIDANQ
jgi:hypothetical protein